MPLLKGIQKYHKVLAADPSFKAGAGLARYSTVGASALAEWVQTEQG